MFLTLNSIDILKYIHNILIDILKNIHNILIDILKYIHTVTYSQPMIVLFVLYD